MNDLAASLEILKSLNPEIPESDQYSQLSVSGILADIYERQSAWKDAYKARTRQLEMERKFVLESQNDSFSRQTAELGLQVEEEKSKVLQKENELQASRLHEAELAQRLRTWAALSAGVVAIGSISLLLLLRKKNGMIERSRREINALLDNIKTGIFSISDPIRLTIDRRRSKGLELVLNADPKLAYTLDTLLFEKSRLSPDRIDIIRASLSGSIGENVLSFEINAEHLPKELAVDVRGKTRTIELDWSTILGTDNTTVLRILVSCRDVTELRDSQKSSEAQQRELGMIQQLIAVPHLRFLRFVGAVKRALEENRQILEASSEQDNLGLKRSLRMVFINLHTIKGAARTLDLQEISSSIHAAEDLLTTMMTQGFDRNILLENGTKIMRLIDEYVAIAEKKLNRDDKAASKVNLEESFVKRLLDRLLTGILPAVSEILPLLKSTYTPLDQLVDEAQSNFPRLAKDLGKPVPLVKKLGLDDIFLDHEAHAMLADAFLHLVRNSMDHGLETEAERLHCGKPGVGTFLFKAQMTSAGDCVISMSDDGRGLALEKIKSIGIAKGLIAVDRTYEASEIAELIFSEGFSTASSVTEISGRGVGMGAVREFIARLGGSLQIEFTDAVSSGYAPFQFTMLIPALHIKRMQGLALESLELKSA
ncbi:MAG TPA: ATP-binding protein [Oligoflexus sp.]|uniref:ATP-binding protein n=1 Tax=Oligoflexus sp. TaxID=1971216 RepID=UPI002D4AA8D1|nr:ATP-binding protein [Oligoflexus sp.]HYX34666.1 ATP-binding protein [Oligoflexus sp.]